MASGRVCTGFSLPYVATYSATGGAVTYSSGQKLARGVNVSITPESGDDNNFYADNVLAESANTTFTGGEVTLTVDGLLEAAEKLIMGLPTSSGGWMTYNDDQAVPYVGIGFIARYQSDGVVTYVPYVLVKCMFNQINTSAATQEENIEFQTQELTAKIFRGDDAKHAWKHVGDEEDTEAAAEAALKTKLGIT
jgi:phi13 family phage major tail protein